MAFNGIASDSRVPANLKQARRRLGSDLSYLENAVSLTYDFKGADKVDRNIISRVLPWEIKLRLPADSFLPGTCRGQNSLHYCSQTTGFQPTSKSAIGDLIARTACKLELRKDVSPAVQVASQ